MSTCTCSPSAQTREHIEPSNHAGFQPFGLNVLTSAHGREHDPKFNVLMHFEHIAYVISGSPAPTLARGAPGSGSSPPLYDSSVSVGAVTA